MIARSSLSSLAVGFALVASTTAACKKPTNKRTGDAAAVEVVTAPVVAPPPGTPGAALEEIEPNDNNDTAMPLALGGTVHAKIGATEGGDSKGPDEVDRYRIDVTQVGALAVSVAALDAVDLVLDLEDASGTVVARSDRGGARVREGVPNFGVVPGRYIAVVRAKKPAPVAPPKKKGKKAPVAPPEPAKPVGGPYEITAAMVTPAAGAEHEPDDERGQANDLIAGDVGTGYIGWLGDADAWKVSVEALSAKNALDIELSAVDGVALQLEISDGVGKPIAKRTGPKNGPLVVRGFAPQVPAGAPPFHYLTVRDGSPRGKEGSNPETAYQIRVAAKVLGPDAELEPNDTPETAMEMPSDRKGVRAQWSAGDVDCFRVPADEAARSLVASIDTPSELDLAIEILVADQVVARSDHPGKGAAEKAEATVPANQPAVIRVRGSESTAESSYELVISEGASP